MPSEKKVAKYNHNQNKFRLHFNIKKATNYVAKRSKYYLKKVKQGNL